MADLHVVDLGLVEYREALALQHRYADARAEEAIPDTLLLLERERARLEALARALLSRETLDQPEAYAIAGVAAPAPEDSDDEGSIAARAVT